MPINLSDIDAHEQPPDGLRAAWKRLSRSDAASLQDIADAAHDTSFVRTGTVTRAQAAAAFAHLDPALACHAVEDRPVLHHPLLPDLFIIPNLIPPRIQLHLLNTILHTHLSNPSHATNLTIHHAIPSTSSSSSSSITLPSATSIPSSFFALPPTTPFPPLDPSIHKPLTATQVLSRRLHWLTLGGQYDWTRRVYPDTSQPAFPPDLAAFLHALFPQTTPQAAIVNLYSPGDTMMMHRDVSERSAKGLVSLSLGCEGLFMIAPSSRSPASCSSSTHPSSTSTPPPSSTTNPPSTSTPPPSSPTHPPSSTPPSLSTSTPPPAHPAPNDDTTPQPNKDYIVLRLRSGDAIYMTGHSRYAWHGVPKVLRDTCPPSLADWPVCNDDDDAQYAHWKGWLRTKRVNINVRQMED